MSSLTDQELALPISAYCRKVTAQAWAPFSGTSEIAQPEATEVPDTVRIVPRGVARRNGSVTSTVLEGHNTLSLLSFNLLADCYVRVKGQPWNAFEYCEDVHLAWEARLPLILQQLQCSAADVICLQEVMLEKRDGEWQLPAWTDELKGYVGVLQGLKQKEWEKQSERNERLVGRKVPTGVATFYNSKCFEESAPAKHGAGSGTILFLRYRQANDKGAKHLEVAIANTHLVGDPSKFDQHIKALDGLKKNFGQHEMRMICGDFNGECEPESEVAKWLANESFLEAPTGTSWAEPGNAQRLDHIFYSGKGMNVLAASGNLDPAEVASGLPCASCPSDHSPVEVCLALQGAQGR